MIEDPAGRSRPRPLPPGIATIPFFHSGWPKPGQGPLRFPDLPSRHPAPGRPPRLPCASRSLGTHRRILEPQENHDDQRHRSGRDPGGHPDRRRAVRLRRGVPPQREDQRQPLQGQGRPGGHQPPGGLRPLRRPEERLPAPRRAAPGHERRPPRPDPGDPPARPGDPRPGRARGTGLQGRHDDRPDQPGGAVPGDHAREPRQRHQPQDRRHRGTAPLQAAHRYAVDPRGHRRDRPHREPGRHQGRLRARSGIPAGHLQGGAEPLQAPPRARPGLAGGRCRHPHPARHLQRRCGGSADRRPGHLPRRPVLLQAHHAPAPGCAEALHRQEAPLLPLPAGRADRPHLRPQGAPAQRRRVGPGPD